MEQAVGVRVLPPEFAFGDEKISLGWRNGKRTASRAPGAVARWGFESPLQHLAREWCNWQTHRPQKAALVSSNLTSRISFDVRARVAQAGRGGGLKPRRLRVRVSPRASARPEGVYANGQSGLSFKQVARRLCGFEPRHPCQNVLALAVAQQAERCTVNAEIAGSSPVGRPFTSQGALAKPGRRHATLYRADAGSNPARPANLWNCGREVRHTLVEREDDGSSPSSSA